MSNILLIGGNGYIGSKLQEVLEVDVVDTNWFNDKNDGEDFKGTVPLKEKQNMTELEEDFEKDSQLHHAVSLLFGWDVMVSTFKNNQFENFQIFLETPLGKKMNYYFLLRTSAWQI